MLGCAVALVFAGSVVAIDLGRKITHWVIAAAAAPLQGLFGSFRI